MNPDISGSQWRAERKRACWFEGLRASLTGTRKGPHTWAWAAEVKRHKFQFKFGLETSMCFVDASKIACRSQPDKKLVLEYKFFWTQLSLRLCTAYATCTRALDPGSRAQEGRSERRAVLSRAHEAEQRDGQVRFSVRTPLSPRVGSWPPVLSLHVRRLFLWNTWTTIVERAVCRV